MSGIEVVVIVGSILAAFGNGRNLFKQMTANKRKRQGSKEIVRLNDDEIVLHKSLKSRPAEIKAQYDHNVAQLGYQYALGDSTSHAHLLSTLTVLNTGLLNLVNVALSEDAKAKVASRVMLLNLSEKTATDTLSALGELNTRLMASSSPVMNRPLKLKDPNQAKVHRKSAPADAAMSPKKKRPGPGPLLVQAGWCKPRSSSSSSSSITSTSTSKTKKASQSTISSHQRSKSSPAIPQMEERQSSKLPTTPRHSPTALSMPSTPVSMDVRSLATPPPQYSRSPPQPFLSLPPRPSSRPERQPSMMLVPADFFENDILHDMEQAAPPRPPKIPLRQPSTKMRYRPLSTATFMTASTKIGEIPESHWPDRHMTSEEQQRKPMPYVIPPPLMVPEVKRRGKLFKFWRKDTKSASLAAH